MLHHVLPVLVLLRAELAEAADRPPGVLRGLLVHAPVPLEVPVRVEGLLALRTDEPLPVLRADRGHVPPLALQRGERRGADRTHVLALSRVRARLVLPEDLFRGEVLMADVASVVADDGVLQGRHAGLKTTVADWAAS